MYIARFRADEKDQSVKDHLERVAYLGGYFAKDSGLYHTATVCGMLHDMGKYTQEFQEYIKEAKRQTKNKTFEQWKKTVKTVDHGIYGAKYLYEAYGKTAKGMEKFLCHMVAEIVAYHHGGLPDNVAYGQRGGLGNEATPNTVPLLERMATISDEALDGVVTIFLEDNPSFDLESLFQQSLIELQRVVAQTRNKQFELGLVIKNVYSYLVDADRLDSYFFESDLFEDRTIFQENKGAEALWTLYLQRLETQMKAFSEKVSEHPAVNLVNEVRESISKQCYDFATKETGIYTLTVPTGGGKTLSSLRFALNHSIVQKKKRIFYIIPYTTIIEQNAKVTRDVLDCGENLLEYHSNITNDTEAEGFKIISERFDSPIVFTTMVQFLNCFYAKGNDNIRRMHQFEDAVIIFDEIQTLPLKCTALFFNLISYLKTVCHTTSVLCTATQPNFDVIKKKLSMDFDGEIIANFDEVYHQLKRMEVVDHTKDRMTFPELSDFVCQVKEKNTSVLVVVNKVKSAEDLFDLLQSSDLKDTKLILLTSRLCATHRADVIRNLKASLAGGESVICISTQLIEAGVDISFSSVLRIVCGLDSIAQTSGRGNRNGEKDMGHTYIVDVEEDVSMLKEIALGQKHTRDLLSLYQENPQDYDHSLLSPKAMDGYYGSYFADGDIKKHMDYPLKNPTEGSIFELLSHQKSRSNEITTMEPLSFNHQFKTAAQNFAVIETKTYGVIVPYDAKAKGYIGVILANASLSEKYEALKELQKYSVTIYENLLWELSKEGAFVPNELEGIYILSEDYYDKEYKGVTTQKKLGLTMF